MIFLADELKTDCSKVAFEAFRYKEGEKMYEKIGKNT